MCCALWEKHDIISEYWKYSDGLCDRSGQLAWLGLSFDGPDNLLRWLESLLLSWVVSAQLQQKHSRPPHLLPQTHEHGHMPLAIR